MTRERIEHIIHFFGFYFSELTENEHIDEQLRNDILELMLLSDQLFKNKFDRVVFHLLTKEKKHLEMERLAIFNGREVVSDTLTKFINIFVQYYEKNPYILNNLDHLYITEEMFEGWIYDDEDVFIKSVLDGDLDEEMDDQREEEEEE